MVRGVRSVWGKAIPTDIEDRCSQEGEEWRQDSDRWAKDGETLAKASLQKLACRMLFKMTR